MTQRTAAMAPHSIERRTDLEIFVPDGDVIASGRRFGKPISLPVSIAILWLTQAVGMIVAALVSHLILRDDPDGRLLIPRLGLAVVAALLFLVIATFTRAIELDHGRWGSVRFLRILAAAAMSEMVAITGYYGIFGTEALAADKSGIWPVAWFVTAATVILLLGLGLDALVQRWRADGRLARLVVVFGGGSHGACFMHEVTRCESPDFFVRAYFDDRLVQDSAIGNAIPCLGNADDLAAYVQRERVDEIVIALPWSAHDRILHLLRRLHHLPVPVRLAPEYAMLRLQSGQLSPGTALMPLLRPRPISEHNLVAKALFDRVVAGTLLTLISPLLVLIAVLVKLDSQGPALFRQKRLGFNNRAFEILKFRTMRPAAANEAARQARRTDPRITRIGAFLRRSSLDELPQLINVFRGDMSLVGPRPHPIWTRAGDLWNEGGDQPLEAFIHEYASRHRVKPGITGWAQIHGYRGETETVDKMKKRVEHDLHYIDNWSLWLDIRIVLMTVVTVATGKNAH
jgi:Undecaprenyl-phosphate glucose phosphotransferase